MDPIESTAGRLSNDRPSLTPESGSSGREASNHGSKRAPTRLVRRAAWLIAILVLQAFSGTAAWAHSPLITADAYCDLATGEVVIDYTATAWQGVSGFPETRENPRIDILIDNVLVDSGAFVRPDFSFSGSLQPPSGASTGDVLRITAVAVGTWGGGAAPGGSDSVTVTLPSDDCAPAITLEKFTNGYDADDADGFPVPTPPAGGFVVGASQVPLIEIGDSITWTYVVQNNSSETLVNVTLTDSEGGPVSCPKTILAPGETMTCLAMGTALDLDSDPDVRIVDGCSGQGMGRPQPTYENLAVVVGTGSPSGIEVSAQDPSHYCNPPDVMLEKFTNGHDGDNASGMPDPNSGSFEPGSPAVAEVAVGDPIVWTYRVTNNGDEELGHIEVTDSRDVVVTCPMDTLAPGESMICTAMGSAEDLAMTGGDVEGCDGAGTGETRPTYENLGSVLAQGTTSGLFVEDDDPSHYCNPVRPPDCGLTIAKTCELPPPPAPPAGKCEGKLQAFTMIWDGLSAVGVSGVPNDAPGGVVNPGDAVSFFGPFSSNDVIVTLDGTSESTFHVSCSDRDMDGDTATNEDQQQVSPFGRDCGKSQGNGKGSSGVNDWLLEGFVDKNGAVLDCTPEPAVGATSCEFTPNEANCDTLGKPSNLTLVYSGGGCPGDNDQGSKSDCTGGVDAGLPVTVTLDGGTFGTVSPGESFVVPTTGSNTRVVLSNVGGTETNDIHTSCSAPLAAGDMYGSLTLTALDGIGLGSDVIYAYQVSNDGMEVVDNIIVDDDQLDFIGSIASLAPGESETLTATAFISTTTTNVASVDGDGPPGAQCSAESNPVTVTVLPPPPCAVDVAFKELKEDQIKWTLSNGSRKATLDTFQLVFPAGFEAIKEVKLDGGVFKNGDSATFPDGVGSGVLIGSEDWTEQDVAKRELDPGESRTLEIRFTKKLKGVTADDFDLNATFEEGCMIAF